MVAVGELVLGAVLGAVFGELFELVRASITEVFKFRGQVDTLKDRLWSLKQLESNLYDGWAKKRASHLIWKGWHLAVECSKVSLLNLSKIKHYASEITYMVSLISTTEDLLIPLHEARKQQTEIRTRLCSLPDPQEMEMDLLDDEPQLSVVSAPEGSGENMLSEEDGIEGEVAGVLPATVKKLFQTVKNVIDEASIFKTQLKKLESTLDSVTPICKEIDLDRQSDEMKKLIDTLEQGKRLLNQCSTVSQWNLNKRYRHAAKLEELDRLILTYIQLVIHAQARRDAEEIVKKIETARIPTEAGRQEESEYNNLWNSIAYGGKPPWFC